MQKKAPVGDTDEARVGSDQPPKCGSVGEKGATLPLKLVGVSRNTKSAPVGSDLPPTAGLPLDQVKRKPKTDVQ